jgi:hypothetical protein
VWEIKFLGGHAVAEKSILLPALILKYKAQVAEAKAILKLYLSEPSAVADHSGFLLELDNWLTRLIDSEEKLRALEKHFPPQPNDNYVVTVSGAGVNVEYED